MTIIHKKDNLASTLKYCDTGDLSGTTILYLFIPICQKRMFYFIFLNFKLIDRLENGHMYDIKNNLEIQFCID